MLKKLLCACLCLCMLLPVLTGCSGTPAAASPETTAATTAPTEPKPTETPEEANALRIMIIGSSRSVNTFQLLYPVFKDQMPDKEITLGVMYYTGGQRSAIARGLAGKRLWLYGESRAAPQAG